METAIVPCQTDVEIRSTLIESAERRMINQQKARAIWSEPWVER